MRTGYKKPLVALLSIAILISSFLTGTTLVVAEPIVADLIQALRYDTEAAIPEFATVNCDVILRVDMSSDYGTLIKDGVEINWPGTGFNRTVSLGSSIEDYIVTVPGVYVASVTSDATTTVVHFTIDRTGPALTAFRSGTENPVLNGAYVRYDVEIVTEPETVNTVVLDGVSIDWPEDATFADEGVYQIVSTDLAGNFSTIGFTIDKTGPTIYLEYDYVSYPTLGPVLVVASTDEPALLNTVTHSFVADGYFYFIATDRAGNITIKQAHVDWIKTWAPTLHVQVEPTNYGSWSATDLSDGAYTHHVVYTWVSDDWYSYSNIEVTLNGTLIHHGNIQNTSLSSVYVYNYYLAYNSEGHYVVTATDDLGNESTFSFIIDWTAPTISGVSDEGLYNEDVVITAADDHVLSSITLNDVPFTSGGTVSAEGDYTVVATDAAGNTLTYDFTIDLTAPTIVGVSDGSYYNVTKAPTFEVGATAKLNTVAYTSGTSISAEGVYTLVVTDAAGNSTTVEFTIDKTKPVIVITYDPDTYDAEDWYNEDITVDAAFSDTYLTGDTSDSHTFTANGEYTFTAYDLAGNETTVTITIENIDRQPDIYVNKPSTDADLESGDRSNDSVDVSTWNSTTTTVTFTGMYGSASNYSNQPIASVSEDGEFYAGDYNGYWNGETWLPRVYRDGTYVVTAVNAHGFSTTFTFILDSSYPRITINDYNQDWTNGNVLVTATTEAGATLNATRHLFTENGEFTFTSIDALGNTQSVTVEIDNIDKYAYLDVEAYDYDDEYMHDIVDHEFINCSYIQIYTENYYRFLYNGLFDIDYIYQSTDVVIKDGVETDWPQYGEFYVEGSYEVTTTDWLGNVSVIHFVIDRTDPEVTGVEDETYYNSNRTITVTDLNLDTITLNGNAFVSGTVVSAEGDYDLVATDKAGNSILVEFIIDKTAPAVTGVTDDSFYKTDKTITATDTYLDTLTLNGDAFVSGTTVSAEGDYTLIATDHAGNSTTVVFTIDKTVPVVAGITNAMAYNTTRNPTATDLNLATITLNGAAFVSGTAVSADGVYTVIATDKAGNATTVVFTVDKTAPFITGVKSGTVTSVAGGSTVHTDVTVTVAVDAVTYSATKNGVAFAWPTASRFTLPATYVVTAADALGNTRTYTFVIMKPIITARKSGTTTYLTNGGYSNVNVFVAVTQYSTRSAKRNGVTIAWPVGGGFTLEGTYLITAKDSFGAITTFTFEIHKIMPSVSMKTTGGTVIYNGGSTYSNVVVRVTCPILASKTVKLNGALIAWPVNNTFTAKGLYTITATDKAGNVRVRTFTRK